MRCFIALGLEPLPGPSMKAGLQTLRTFRELAVPPPENLHVTLAFMGELAEAGVAGAAEAVKAAAAAAGGRWKVGWAEAGAFPSIGRPRVIWLGLADPAMTTTIQGLLISELRSRGLPSDERPFRPHLTLARVRGGLTREKAADLKAVMAVLPPPAPASVEALVLYRSHPAQGGSTYEELARTSL
ncbi:MAG TPA: RNA 2',3'-cyclic phosphodiesterase [Candidatus Dormibacteraeota bacterium]|nr:RNA 2',3'-cyclic phosphodiesterase [Candidatus Dormibacteraeota bacterium]